MKFLTYIFTLAYLFTSSSLLSERENHSDIVVVVNEKSILRSDLHHRIKLVAKNSGVELTPAIYSQFKDRVLNQMIDEVLQIDLAEKFNLTPSADQIKDAWHRMEKNYGMGEGELEVYLKSEQVPRRIIEDQIKAILGWQTYIHEKYDSLVQVNDIDIQNEMDRLNEEKSQDKALLSELVLYYDTPAEAEKTKAKAQKLSEQIKTGGSFPLIAQEFSRSASAANGGDIGWVELDQLEVPLKNAVKTLKKGDISDPIPIKNGYSVIGMRDRHGVGSLGDPIEYVTLQQVEFAFPILGGNQAIEETFLKATATKKESKTCSMLQKLTKDRPRVTSRQVVRQPCDGLHPELQKVLKSLKPGESSQLLNTGKSFILFMLCDREVVKPNEPNKKDIRGNLIEKKLTMIAEREMRNLRRAAHIERRAENGGRKLEKKERKTENG